MRALGHLDDDLITVARAVPVAQGHVNRVPMARIFRLDSAAVLPGMPDAADEVRRIGDALDQSSNASAAIVHAHGEHFDAIVLHQRRGISPRQYQGRRSIIRKDEHIGFNGRVAILITNSVGTMWCAYAFALLALISLPDAIKAGTAALVAWIAQTFLQLVLLSVIMVGQKVSAAASDKQALQTYKDAEALLKIQDEVHRLIQINNDLTEEIHAVVAKKS